MSKGNWSTGKTVGVGLAATLAAAIGTAVWKSAHKEPDDDIVYDRPELPDEDEDGE